VGGATWTIERMSRRNSARPLLLDWSVPIVFAAAALFSSASYGQAPDPVPADTSPPADIRDRNLYEPSTDGPVSLTRKLATNVVLDQGRIWTSPFRMNRQNARWWLIFSIGTGALIASDHRISQQLPNTGTSVRVGTDLSTAGQFYSVFPFAGSLYLVGLVRHDKKLSETGALGVQALVDSAILVNVLKTAVRRERPLSGDGGGHFEKGGSSFPSGHAIEAWSLAAVVAKQYGNHKWVPVVSYAYATAVSVSRVTSRQHFPSDVLAASAMGFFIGRYVVSNNDLHQGHKRKQAGWLKPSFGPCFSAGGIGAQLRWNLAASE
jgi:membrane-associated phospholipid phosphatase